jgi:flagellin
MAKHDADGAFTLTAQDGIALTKADASAADGVGTITVSDLAASTEKTIVVRYTADGGEIFDQTIKLTAAAQTESEATTTGAFSSSATVPDSDTTSTLANKGVSNLTFEEARQGTVETSVLSSGLAAFVTANPAGTYTVTGDDKASFNIDGTTGKLTTASIVDFEAKESYDINVVYTKGSDSFTETVKIAVTDSDADSGTHLADVSLTTSEGAATAVTILDKALGQISSSQAKLGAIQNRLQHNIDNLSMASMLTETARGRVVDADFARETSELSKQQILGQAATSMLAQANQSKQSVLALLQ